MDLVDMGRRFHAASGQPCGFDPDAFGAFMRHVDTHGGLIRTERGFIAGILTPAWCDPKWLVAVEFAWWAEDGKGLWLLRQFERWAKAAGAKEVRMTTLNKLPRAQKILQRRGYVASEQSWARVI